MTSNPTSSKDHDVAPRRRSTGRSKSWRRKQPRHIDPFANRQKSLESHGINFGAMLLGLVASFTGLLLAYNRVFPSHSPNPTIQTIVAEVDDAADVASKLAQLQATYPGDKAGPDQRLEFQQSLLSAAEQLHQSPGLTEAERVKIHATQLDACRQLIAICREMGRDSRAAVNQMELIAKPLVDHFDQGLQLQSRLALLELAAIDGESNTRIIAEHCLDLIDRFPVHPKVCEAIPAAIHAFHDREGRQPGAKLAKLLADKIAKEIKPLQDESSQEDLLRHQRLQELAVECADWAAVWESDYDGAWENRAIDGAAGLQKIQTVALGLAESREAGLSRLKLVEEIAIWLEQHQASQLALPIHEALAQRAQRADGYQYPEVRDRADRFGTRGIKRCELYQQPLEISGARYQGPPLDNSLLDGRIGIIVFFSARGRGASQSILVLEQLKGKLLAWGREPVQMLAVCIDDPSDPESSQRLTDVEQNSEDAFIICVRGPDDDLPIFEQSPSDRVPRIMLTDRKRRVVELDIPAEQVWTQVGNFLLPEGR